MTRLSTVGLFASFALLAAIPSAFGQPANMDEWCPDPAPEVDAYRALRNLSLDLRGTIPTVEEYDLVDPADGIPDSLIDEWLRGEAFLERVASKHRDLLWNNVSNFGYMGNPTALRNTGGLLWRRDQAILYRGAIADRDLDDDGINDIRAEAPCNAEPAEWDENGDLLFEDMGDGTLREGYVEITDAFWDTTSPATTYYVCAADAQEAAEGQSGADCSTRAGWGDAGCGCGPNLRWCRYGNSEVPVRRSFGKQIDEKVKALVRDDRPYTDLFYDNTVYMNGPMAFFWKHQAQFSTTIRLTPKPVIEDDVPDLDYGDEDTWVAIPGTDEHAGVLTSPAFLIRFMSNRARANRFYNSFLCQPFQPPEDGLPAADDLSAQTLDLQQRDGCKYCHSTLEPVAAHWGRWLQMGGAYLGAEEYPAFSQDCYDCAVGSGSCSAICRAYYVTSALNEQEEPYLGWLNAYKFRRTDHHANVEAGPRRLIETTTTDGRFTNCTARTAAEWLLGRSMEEFEEPWLSELEAGFIASDFSYRELVRAIVTSPVYGRVR
jgi:hypothetical protein